MGDLLGFGMSDPAPASPAKPALQLQPNPKSSCTPQVFQENWGKWGVKSETTITLGPATSTLATVSATLDGLNLGTIASGEVPGGFKAYFCAVDTSQTLFLLELLANGGAMKTTIKTTGDA